MTIWDFWDRVIATGVLSVAIKNKWPLKLALHYVTLCAAMTTPALLTVPDLFGNPKGVTPERRRLLRIWTGSYLNGLTISLDRNVDIVFYVDGSHSRRFKG